RYATIASAAVAAAPITQIDVPMPPTSPRLARPGATTISAALMIPRWVTRSPAVIAYQELGFMSCLLPAWEAARGSGPGKSSSDSPNREARLRDTRRVIASDLLAAFVESHGTVENADAVAEALASALATARTAWPELTVDVAAWMRALAALTPSPIVAA